VQNRSQKLNLSGSTLFPDSLPYDENNKQWQYVTDTKWKAEAIVKQGGPHS
jgi:hypothetical protein